MKGFLIGVLAIAMVAMIAVGAQAGSFSLATRIAAAFDPLTFAQLPTIPNPIDTNLAGPVVYQVEVVMTVNSLDSGERSFANTGFNIVFGGDTHDSGEAGWQPDTRLGDSNGASPGGAVPLWFANIDAGIPGDEQGILVAIAGGLTGLNDNRRNIGQVPGSQGAITGTNPYPTGELGSFFVLWDGTAGPGLKDPANPEADYFELSGILFQSANNAGQFGNTTEGATVRVFFGRYIPEPSSLVLMGSCFAGLVLRRRAA